MTWFSCCTWVPEGSHHISFRFHFLFRNSGATFPMSHMGAEDASISAADFRTASLWRCCTLWTKSDKSKFSASIVPINASGFSPVSLYVVEEHKGLIHVRVPSGGTLELMARVFYIHKLPLHSGSYRPACVTVPYTLEQVRCVPLLLINF